MLSVKIAEVMQMTGGKISYALIRVLAEEAWDQGDRSRAAGLVRIMESGMICALQQSEGCEIPADEVALVVPADRA